MKCRHASQWVLTLLLWNLASSIVGTLGAYDLVHDYSGPSFFNEWDFYGYYDNLTSGDIIWLDQYGAYGQKLATVNSAGNAILKVDNTTNVPFNQKRNSVRITTQASFGVGSLWITDIVHLPYGCSVWPGFWSLGPLWPNDGEIDIIEGVNRMDNNQMAIHGQPGCSHATGVQTGISTGMDCSQPSGCTVAETANNSYGPGFNAAGGGVFAAQFDSVGIFIWFWSRPNIPPSISQATSTSSIDISQWGTPSASYLSTGCNVTQFFGMQKLVYDITLCGIWAGLPVVYQQTCNGTGPTNICYNDNVIGSGSNYAEAYFEIKYLRTYTINTGGGGGGNTPPLASNNTATITGTTTTTAETTTAKSTYSRVIASATDTNPSDLGVPLKNSAVKGRIGGWVGLVVVAGVVGIAVGTLCLMALV